MNRTFGQRFFIVAWLFSALIYMLLFAATLAMSIRLEHGWAVYGRAQRPLPGAIPVNENVMQAYYGGRMSAEERRQFEDDARAGQIVIPSNHNLVKPDTYKTDWAAITVALGAGLIWHVLGCLTQFLFLGYGSPVRLMRSPGHGYALA